MHIRRLRKKEPILHDYASCVSTVVSLRLDEAEVLFRLPTKARTISQNATRVPPHRSSIIPSLLSNSAEMSPRISEEQLELQKLRERSFNPRHGLNYATATQTISLLSRQPSRDSDEQLPSSTSQLLLPRPRSVSIGDSERRSPQTVAAEDHAEPQRGGEENGDHRSSLSHSQNRVQNPSPARSVSPNVPFVLRQNVLYGFIACLISIFISLEMVSYIAKKNQGLGPVLESEHGVFMDVLFAYSPTAISTLLAVFWDRVLYYVKARIPWDLMTKDPRSADKNLFLDYISPDPVSALLVALRSKHYPVVASILASTLITLAIVASTGLFMMQDTIVTRDGVSLHFSDRFDDANFNSSLIDGSYALYAANLLSGNLSLGYPKSTNRGFAVQSLMLPDLQLPTVSSFNVTTQAGAFSADLSCYPGELSGAKLRYRIPGSKVSHPDPFLLMNLTSAVCDTSFNISMEATSVGSATFGNMSLIECPAPYGTVGRKFMFVLLARYIVPLGHDGLSDIQLDGQHINVTTLFCEPRFDLNQAMVTHSSEGALQEVVPDTSSMNLTGLTSLTGWDVALAFKTSLSNSADMYWPQGMDIDSSYINFLLASAPDKSLTELFDANILESLSRLVFTATSAQIAKHYLTVPADSARTATTGIISFQTLRLQIQDTSLRILEAIVLTLVFCTIFVINTSSKSSVPLDASSLGGLLRVLAASPDLATRLSGTGSWSLQSMILPVETRPTFEYEAGKFQSILADEINTYPQSTSTDPNRHREYWNPFAASRTMKCLVIVVPTVVIICLEITLRLSSRRNGLGAVATTRYLQYIWTLVPSITMVTIKLMHEIVSFPIQLLDPYVVLGRGTSNIRSTLAKNYLKKSLSEDANTALSSAGYAVAAVALSTSLASSLTVLANGLFTAVAMQRVVDVPIKLRDRLDMTVVDGLSYDYDLKSSGLSGTTISAANLIIDGLIDYPHGTFETLVIPGIDLDFSSIASKNLTYDGTLQVQLPVLQPSLTCEMIPQDELTSSIAFDKKNATLWFTYPKLASCGCEIESWHEVHDDGEHRQQCSEKVAHVATDFPGTASGVTILKWFGRTSYTTLEDPTERVLDVHDPLGIYHYSSRSTDCPHNSAIFGKVSTDAKNIAGITCDFQMQEFDAKLHFDLPDLAVKRYEVVEGSVHPSKGNDSSSRLFELTLLKFFAGFTEHTAEDLTHVAIDPIMTAVFNDTELENQAIFENVSGVAARLSFIYNNFYTQYLNQVARVPLEKPLSVNATIIDHNHFRVVQKEGSTRSLQALLTTMTAFALVAFYFSNTRNLLTKNPCSIIAQASFFADSEMLKLVREGIEEKGMTDNALDILKGHFASLGWWTREGESEKRFGIDIGKAE